MHEGGGPRWNGAASFALHGSRVMQVLLLHTPASGQTRQTIWTTGAPSL